jgi:hypothetical protein
LRLFLGTEGSGSTFLMDWMAVTVNEGRATESTRLADSVYLKLTKDVFYETEPIAITVKLPANRFYQGNNTGPNVVLYPITVQGKAIPPNEIIGWMSNTWGCHTTCASLSDQAWIPNSQHPFHYGVKTDTTKAYEVKLLAPPPGSYEVRLYDRGFSDYGYEKLFLERIGITVGEKATTTPEIAGIVVLENQLANEAGTSGAPSAMAYPFKQGTNKSGSDRRTLFIWGRHLPKQPSSARLESPSPYLEYTAKTGNLEALTRQGWEKSIAIEPDAGPDRYSSLLVDVTLKQGVAPGLQELKLNGARGTWGLVFNDARAVLGFVRERDDPRQFPMPVIYINDRVFVDLVYDVEMFATGVGVELLRYRGGAVERVAVMRAVKVENRTQPIKPTYRAGPFLLYELGTEPPGISDVGMRIAVRTGDRLAARLYDPFEGRTVPRIAMADVRGDPAKLGPLWQTALETAAACYSEQHRAVDDDYARETAIVDSPLLLTAWRLKPRSIPLPINPFASISVVRDGIRIGPSVERENHDVALLKGDHAAAILIRDEFVRMSQALSLDYERLQGDRARLRAFRAAGQRLSNPEQDPFWGAYRVAFPGSRDVRIPLWQTLDAETHPHDFDGMTAEQARDWAEGAVASAFNQLRQEMRFAEQQALGAGCDLRKLLVLAGQKATPVVARIVPRLVRKEAGTNRWTSDNLARAFVENLAIAGAAVRALREYAAIDDAYKALGVALVTAGTSFALSSAGYATAAAYAAAAGDALDAAIFGTKSLLQYYTAEEEYQYALGAAPVLGRDGFLAEAEAARQNGVLAAVGVIAPGVSGALALKNLRNLKAVERGRDLVRSHPLDNLAAFSDDQRLDLAAYYADLSIRGALDDADRAALGKFRDALAQSQAATRSASGVSPSSAQTRARPPETIEEVLQAIRAVNPGGPGTGNCHFCSESVEDILRGRPAAPAPSRGSTSLERGMNHGRAVADNPENIPQSRRWIDVKSVDQIETFMSALPPGSHGRVQGLWKKRWNPDLQRWERDGHEFNVWTDKHGKAHFIDGQTGTTIDPRQLAFEDLRMLMTNGDGFDAKRALATATVPRTPPPTVVPPSSPAIRNVDNIGGPAAATARPGSNAGTAGLSQLQSAVARARPRLSAPSELDRAIEAFDTYVWLRTRAKLPENHPRVESAFETAKMHMDWLQRHDDVTPELMDALHSRGMFTGIFGTSPERLLGGSLDNFVPAIDISSTTPAMRRAVQRKRWTNIDGTLADPIPGEMEADHIFPVSRIMQLPGFFQLRPDDMTRILQWDINIQPLPSWLNQSKGQLLADQWHTVLLNNPRFQQPRVTAGFINALAQQQALMRQRLQSEIRRTLSSY